MMNNGSFARVKDVLAFLEREKPDTHDSALTAVSLFSGAGISDAGYAAAGFQCVVQVEIDSRRAELGRRNFPESCWLVGDTRRLADQIAVEYARRATKRLDLLVATPPCQGMSSSNPGRGKRGSRSAAEHAEKNRLLMSIVPVVHRLKPRIVVAENVRQILSHTISYRGRTTRLIDRLRAALPSYRVFEGIVNVADFGVPQDRRRAIVVAVRNSEPWVSTLKKVQRNPWPRCTHAAAPSHSRSPWVTVREWLEALAYAPLDAKCAETAIDGHPLHRVPYYRDHRYSWIAGIPPYSGKSAYENADCPTCGASQIAGGRIKCPSCGGVLFNRPFVRCPGGARLIRGFESSYRRMPPDMPARTITTNTSHLGSDYKIHPWENRVLSALECADLQTVPRWFSWSAALEARRAYLVRNVIGEAFPAYFAYLHGKVLNSLLESSKSELKGILGKLAPLDPRDAAD